MADRSFATALRPMATTLLVAGTTFAIAMLGLMLFSSGATAADDQPASTAAASSATSSAAKSAAAKAASAAKVDQSGAKVRTRAEVEALIAAAGKSPPDWWDTVKLNYPPTLELTWTNGKKGEWNPQKYLGAYIFSVLHPNPGKWREGIRLLHEVVSINKADPQKLNTSMVALGRAYFDYVEDYPRAAFWWRKANHDPLMLANCYWKLGCREMAVAAVSNIGRDDTRNGQLIKLWAEMGDLKKALTLAEQKASAGGMPDAAYLAAGNACRIDGQYAKAIDYYQKVVAAANGGRDLKRNKERAAAAVQAVRLYEALDLKKVTDGTYTASCQGYVGPVEVEIVVRAGRLESVKVTRHKESWFGPSITEVPRRIVERQGLKGVDAVTGATVTSDAIMNAAAQALAKGLKN